jgi:chemotaxis signal transduction protein
MRVLVLPLGPHLCAVPFKDVRQVLHAPRLAVLPTAPERLLGLANFAGEIIPAYDSSKLLDLPAFHASHLVLLETSEGLAGITASDLPFPADLMEAAPGFLAHHNEIIPLFDAEQALVAP